MGGGGYAVLVSEGGELSSRKGRVEDVKGEVSRRVVVMSYPFSYPTHRDTLARRCVSDL